MYLYKPAPDASLVVHSPELHGYPCNFIGGDSGPVVVAREYRLHLDLGGTAIFQHRQTGKYYAAVRIGEPSMLPCGENVFQQCAHIKTYHPHSSGLVQGPFTFYDLVFLLEAGPVTPREAIVDGYFGSAIFSLSGHVRELACETIEEALALLAFFTPGTPITRRSSSS
jgi:hypothetical protein